MFQWQAVWSRFGIDHRNFCLERLTMELQWTCGVPVAYLGNYFLGSLYYLGKQRYLSLRYLYYIEPMRWLIEGYIYFNFWGLLAVENSWKWGYVHMNDSFKWNNVYFCRLSSCTGSSSYVDHRLRITGENQNYAIQQCSSLYNHIDGVLQKHLKIFLQVLWGLWRP